jgi:hypothetical protein
MKQTVTVHEDHSLFLCRNQVFLSSSDDLKQGGGEVMTYTKPELVSYAAVVAIQSMGKNGTPFELNSSSHSVAAYEADE